MLPRDRGDDLLLGDSPPMRELRRLIVRFAPNPLPVLVLGPTGCGKGLVASALHRQSQRRGRLVAVNVAALADGLVDSELFGHVRGAFTSAVAPRRGLLHQAHEGTVFLDEVHRLAATTQPRLLRVLETGLFRAVGSDSEVQSDFRVVAAANEDLEQLVDLGRFQGDLLARLARLVIHVPPLATHLDDVPVLALHFIRRLQGLGAVGVTDAGLAALCDYDWPRNVRELQAVIERAVILADRPAIDRTDIQAAIAAGARTTHGDRDPAADHLLRERIDPQGRRERSVMQALDEAGGKVSGAAERLGVSRKTVYRWMAELHIATPERRRRPRREATRDQGHTAPRADSAESRD